MFRKKRFWLVIFAALLVAGAVFIDRWTPRYVQAEAGAYADLKIFTEVLSVVTMNYVEETDPKELIHSAIRGMLRTLDPHSGFLDADSYKEMQVDTKGEFGGLGIQISIRNGILTIISPIEDTPAWDKGLKSGDRIIKIEDELTKDMTLQDAVKRMRGPKGTDVTITILREKTEPFDVTITRAIIKIKSVKSRVIEEDIGYVKIRQFQQRTAKDLAKVLREFEDDGISSLILDLRNNPGGLLNSAVNVTSLFLEPGQMVVYTKTRNGEKKKYMTSTAQTFKKPIVVLVNQGSASASEIVAGAIKDWKRGIVIGTQTFGKGSVQSVIPLSDKAALRLTTARYYTPKGTSIQNTGISPDIKVKLKVIDGAKEHVVIREKDLKGSLDLKDNGDKDKDKKPEKAVLRPKDDEHDTQLQRAIDLLKTWTIFRDLTASETVETNKDVAPSP